MRFRNENHRASMQLIQRASTPTRRNPFIAATLATSLISTAAMAQSANNEAPSPTRDEALTSNLALGIGFNTRQQPYTGVKRDNKVFPLVLWDTRWVKVAGNGLEVKLAKVALTDAQQLSAGLRLSYQRDGYKAGDSLTLSGMEDRKSGIWAGAGVTWTNPIGQVDAQWLADVSGHSKGQRMQIQAEHRFGWGSFGLTPKLQAQWSSSKVVDYYFGVRQQEALPTRPEYSASAATSLGAGLRLDYIAGAHHTVFVDLSETHLPNEIKQSPILDRSNTSQIAVGYLYRF